MFGLGPDIIGPPTKDTIAVMTGSKNRVEASTT
jgi:hypothetical protein